MMRVLKTLLILAFAFILPLQIQSQTRTQPTQRTTPQTQRRQPNPRSGPYTTNVTATITDPDGQLWMNGTYTAQLYNPSSTQQPVYTATGQPVQTLFQNQVINASGALSIALPDNNQISPAGTRWTFALCSDTSAPCFTTTNLLVTGASVDLTAAITPQVIAPRYPPQVNAHGYQDGEVTNPVKGSTYYNVVRSIGRLFNGTIWVDGGGSGAVGGGNQYMVSCYLPTTGSTLQQCGTLATDSTGNNMLAPQGDVSGQSLGGIRYAKQWQSGAGNNGVANASANNQMVVADPGYSQSEKPGIYSFAPSPMYYNDTRIGQNTEFFTNPQLNPSQWNWFNSTASGQMNQVGKRVYSLYNAQWPIWTGSTNSGNTNVGLISNEPGWSYGPTINIGFTSPGCGNANTSGTAITAITTGPGCTAFRTDGSYVGQAISINAIMYTIASVTDATHLTLTASAGTQSSVAWSVNYGNGWSTKVNQSIGSIVRGRGIFENTYGVSQKWGTGDDVGFYYYVHSGSGYTAPNDEGTKGGSISVSPDDGQYSSTCVSGCTTGSTQITGNIGGSGNQGVGRYLIAGNTPSITGNITGITNVRNGTAVTVDATVPVSNAYGYLSQQSYTPINTVGPTFATPTQVTITIVSGAFVPGVITCFQGTHHEQAIPTSVGTVGTTQTVTLPLRNPHVNNTYVYQGGTCGMAFEKVADTMNVSGNNLQYLFDSVGSVDAHTVQLQRFVTGTGTTVPIALAPTGGIANTLSSSGTTVTGSVTTSSLNQYFNGTFNITGASDAALNAPCTGVTFTSALNFTCTIAGLTGTHTTTTAPTATISNNTFNLWQMAEVLDVQNETLTPPQVDGSFTLEPNNIAFTNGTPIVETNHVTQRAQIATGYLLTQNPYGGAQPNTGLEMEWQGNGVVGGGVNPQYQSFISLSNNNAASYYQGSGGWRVPPNGIGLSGPYATAFALGSVPQNRDGIVFNIGQLSPPQLLDPNYEYRLFMGYDNPNYYYLTIIPKSQSMILSNPGPFTVTLGGAFGVTATGASFTFGTNTVQVPTGASGTLALASSATVQDFYTAVTSCTLSASTDTQCSGTITVNPAMPDTTYYVQLTANTNGNGPHAGLSAAVDGALATGSIPYTLTCTFNCGTMGTTPTLYVHAHHN